MISALTVLSGANEATGNERVGVQDRMRGQIGQPSPFVESSLWIGACYACIVDISYEAALVYPEAIRSYIYDHIMRPLCIP